MALMTGGDIDNMVPNNGGTMLLINVTGVERVGKGPLAAYVFRIETHLHSNQFGTQEFQVYRKLSDFTNLFNKLDEKFSRIGVIVPPPPRKTNLNIFYTIRSSIKSKWEVNVGK